MSAVFEGYFFPCISPLFFPILYRFFFKIRIIELWFRIDRKITFLPSPKDGLCGISCENSSSKNETITNLICDAYKYMFKIYRDYKFVKTKIQ